MDKDENRINDQIDNGYQENTFNEINDLKHRLQGLSGYIQNDFERMLEDGTIDKRGICDGILEMDLQYDKFINDLNKLRTKAREIMEHHCK